LNVVFFKTKPQVQRGKRKDLSDDLRSGGVSYNLEMFNSGQPTRKHPLAASSSSSFGGGLDNIPTSPKRNRAQEGRAITSDNDSDDDDHDMRIFDNDHDFDVNQSHSVEELYAKNIQAQMQANKALGARQEWHRQSTINKQKNAQEQANLRQEHYGLLGENARLKTQVADQQRSQVTNELIAREAHQSQQRLVHETKEQTKATLEEYRTFMNQLRGRYDQDEKELKAQMAALQAQTVALKEMVIHERKAFEMHEFNDDMIHAKQQEFHNVWKEEQRMEKTRLQWIQHRVNQELRDKWVKVITDEWNLYVSQSEQQKRLLIDNEEVNNYDHRSMVPLSAYNMGQDDRWEILTLMNAMVGFYRKNPIVGGYPLRTVFYSKEEDETKAAQFDRYKGEETMFVVSRYFITLLYKGKRYRFVRFQCQEDYINWRLYGWEQLAKMNLILIDIGQFGFDHTEPWTVLFMYFLCLRYDPETIAKYFYTVPIRSYSTQWASTIRPVIKHFIRTITYTLLGHENKDKQWSTRLEHARQNKTLLHLLLETGHTSHLFRSNVAFWDFLQDIFMPEARTDDVEKLRPDDFWYRYTSGMIPNVDDNGHPNVDMDGHPQIENYMRVYIRE
jgi:hypothetical protein